MSWYSQRGARVLLTIALGFGVISAAAAADDIVAKREGAMKAAGGALKALGQAAKAGQITDAEVKKAQDLDDFAKGLVALFPEGSITPKSRALPAIWSDKDGFAAKDKDFQTATAAVLAAAKTGDAAALGKAVEAAGPVCGACHKAYRGPEKD